MVDKIGEIIDKIAGKQKTTSEKIVKNIVDGKKHEMGEVDID